MLSASELSSIKNGGSLVVAMAQNRDDSSLRKQISSLQYERRHSLRTMEIKRRQFLHHYHQLAGKHSVPLTVLVERKKTRIEDGKREEQRSKSVLDEKTAEFIGGLKARPLTSGVTRKTFLQKLQEEENKEICEKQSNIGENKLPDYQMRSQAMEMYQKSIVLLKKRAENSNPFMASVNSVIERLRGAKHDSNTTDNTEQPVNELTKKIFGKFMRGETSDNDERDSKTLEKAKSTMLPQGGKEQSGNGCDSNGREGKQERPDKDSRREMRSDFRLTQDQEHVSNTSDMTPLCLDGGGDLNNSSALPDGGCSMSTSISDLACKSSEKDQDKTGCTAVWNKTKRQQTKSYNTNSLGTELNLNTKEGSSLNKIISVNVIPPQLTVSKTETGVEAPSNSSMAESGFDQCPGTEKISLPPMSKSKRDHRGASNAHMSPRNPPEHLNTVSDSARFLKETNGRKVSTGTQGTPHEASSGFDTQGSTSPRRFDQTRTLSPHPFENWKRSNNSRKRRSPASNTSPETPVVSKSKTTIIVHHENSSLSKRHSVFENPGMPLVNFGDEANNDMHHDEICNGKTSPVSTFQESDDDESIFSGDVSFNENGEDGPPSLRLISPSTEEGSRENLPELVSKLTPTDSRQSVDQTGRRRMSVQTAGALRLWAEVQKMEEEREKAQAESDVQAYGKLVDALAETESEVVEQAERLEAVKRYRPSLCMSSMAESTTRSTADHSQRRRSIGGRRGSLFDASDPGSTTDVTDEVYKFVQKHYDSADLRRVSLGGPGHPRPTTNSLFTESNNGNNTARRTMAMKTYPQNSSRNGSRPTTPKFRVQSATRKGSADHPNGRKLLTSVFKSVEGPIRRKSVPEPNDKNRDKIRQAMSPSGRSDVEIKDGDDVSSVSSANRKEMRSYSWAPDVSQSQRWHVLALEMLSRNRTGLAKFRTVGHLLQSLGHEYERQRTNMMFEELRYCTYLRLPKEYVPVELRDCDVSSVFEKN